MTTRAPARTKRWTLRLDLLEDGDDTRAHAVLDTGETHLECRTLAHRSPQDPPVAGIGDDYAAGRALIELGHRLLRSGTTGTTGAAANDAALRE
ncbi:dsRBD fold-containing protein [Kitasatospora viridis]|uniref:Uncharacterized protein DUF1876 n=1 Tax=Kitasatospora viridis TaxID=281105 RepID=A0A561TWB8_9ACTN|nr:dsRBD fold-containing protein [Kitasatospora viridis]TWF91407.1 uncharacterized protein DUF1876 [Kitasatospora viridis]